MTIKQIPNRNAIHGWRRMFLLYPTSMFCLLTIAVSWLGAFCLVAQYIFRSEHIPKFSGLMMFPVMLLGPAFSGLFITWATEDASGVKMLLHRMTIWRCSWQWYAVLVIPAALILATLALFKVFDSPVYTPNMFFVGSAFGIIAGFVEETGWTGFALPRLCRTYSTFTSAVCLGLVWSAWHIPVIDYLGTATPHGGWWLEYFLAFSFAMTAIRILIAWLFANTGSLLLAQLMHATSTGALVVLSPPRVSAAQEAFWYAVYGCLLWLVVALIRLNFNSSLVLSAQPDEITGGLLKTQAAACNSLSTDGSTKC